MTAPDFHLFEMIDQYQTMVQHYSLAATERDPGNPDSDMPLLAAFYAAFRAHPRNAMYFSSTLPHYPFNNKGAKFGSTPSCRQWTPEDGLQLQEFVSFVDGAVGRGDGV